MKVAELPDGFGSNQRSVAGEHDDLVIFIARERFARHHERVPGAALSGLQHEVHARPGNRLSHALRLVADDHEDVLRGHDFLRGDYDMRQDRLAADVMQNTRMFRLESRTLARRHDRDGYTRGLGIWWGRFRLGLWLFYHAK